MTNTGVLLSRKWLPATLLLVVLPLVAASPGYRKMAAKYSSTEPVVPKQKEGVVILDIAIVAPEGAGDVRLWLPYPTSNKYQTIEDVEIDGNFDSSGVYREAEHDTISLYTEWNKPKEETWLTYSFKITRKEIIMKNFPEGEGEIPVDIEKYLLPTSLGPTVDMVKDLAVEITKGEKTILGKATAIYDYIVENVKRDPTIIGCGIGDVESLLRDLSGKCADISSVFVALARSVGVPSREIYGTRIAKNGDITGAYHCRVEFYLPGYGWVPVDPSDVLKFHLHNEGGLDNPDAMVIRNYLFGAQTETYVDFYSGKDITLNPPQHGGPLNYFMYPYAEVNGQPLDFVTPGHPVLQEGLEYMVTFQES
ncbi:MAG: transglutaminase-like domain-containing protein [Planctomycetota bacterium]